MCIKCLSDLRILYIGKGKKYAHQIVECWGCETIYWHLAYHINFQLGRMENRKYITEFCIDEEH